MNGGKPKKATSEPLSNPKKTPAIKAAGTANQPRPGTKETSTPTTAVTPKIDPTERSIPPVKITKVMPVARTILVDACRMTLIKFPTERKLGVTREKITQMATKIGKIPATWMKFFQATTLLAFCRSLPELLLVFVCV